MSNNILDRLSEREFGEKKTFNKPTIATIKLDGLGSSPTAGQLIDCSEDFKPIGKKITVRPLRLKYSLLKANQSSKITSTEYTRNTDTVSLFMRNGGNSLPDSKPYATGTPADIRKNDDAFKVVFVLYCVYEGRLIKIKFKGASLSGDNGFIEFKKQFSRTNPMYRYTIDINSNFIEKSRAVSYHYLTFSNPVREDSDVQLEVVEGYLNILDGVNPETNTESVGTSIPKSELEDEFDAF